MAIFDERATALPEPDLRGIRGNSDTKISKAPLASTALEGLTNTLGVALKTDATQATEAFRSNAANLRALEEGETDKLRTTAGDFTLPELQEMEDESVINEISDKFNRLQSSRTMSTSEFALRRETALREAIDRRPHLAQQFRTINNLYGGTAGARASAGSAKATLEEQRFVAIQKAADTAGLDIPDYMQMTREASEIQARNVSGDFGLFENVDISSNKIDLEGIQLLTLMNTEDFASYKMEDKNALIDQFSREQLKFYRSAARELYPDVKDKGLRESYLKEVTDYVNTAASSMKAQNQLNVDAPTNRLKVQPMIVTNEYIANRFRNWERTENYVRAHSEYSEAGSVDTAAMNAQIAYIQGVDIKSYDQMRNNLGIFSAVRGDPSDDAVKTSVASASTAGMLDALVTDFLDNKDKNIKYLESEEGWNDFRSEIAVRFLSSQYFQFIEDKIASESIVTETGNDIINAVESSVAAATKDNRAVDVARSEVTDTFQRSSPRQLMDVVKNEQAFRDMRSNPEIVKNIQQKLGVVSDRISGHLKADPSIVLEPISQKLPFGNVDVPAFSVSFPKEETPGIPSPLGVRRFPKSSISNRHGIQNDIELWNLYSMFSDDAENIGNAMLTLLDEDTTEDQGALDNESYTDADEARLQELLSKQGAK